MSGITTKTVDKEDFRVDSNGWHLNRHVLPSPGHVIILTNTDEETCPVYLVDRDIVYGTDFSISCIGSNGEVVYNEIYPTTNIMLHGQ